MNADYFIEGRPALKMKVSSKNTDGTVNLVNEKTGREFKMVKVESRPGACILLPEEKGK